MKAAVQAGLYNGNSTIGLISPVCSTGNCTWAPYQSLAVYYSSADISSHLKITKYRTPYSRKFGPDVKAIRYSLTKDHYLEDDVVVYRLNLTSAASLVKNDDPYDVDLAHTLNFNQSIAFNGTQNPIADGFMIYYDNSASLSNTTVYSAVEFKIEWCIQTFNTTVTNGTSSTTKLESSRNFTDGDGSSILVQLGREDRYEYNVDSPTHYSLQRYMRSLFNGTIVAVMSTGDLWNTSDAA